MEALVELAARAMLAAPFLVSALDKSLRPGAAMAEILGLAGKAGLNAPSKPALAGVLACQWAGGLALLPQQTAGFGAAVLLAFLVPVTVLAHPFWTFPPDERPIKRDHFFSNAAIAGGLLLVALGAFR